MAYAALVRLKHLLLRPQSKQNKNIKSDDSDRNHSMAYSDLVHLKHLLEEEVICFLRRVLEVEKAKAVEFQARANQGLKSLNIYRNPNDGSCSGGDLFVLKMIDSILKDLDDVSSVLEGFLQTLDSSLQQREIANGLLSGARKIRGALFLCKQASQAAITLRLIVRELIKDSCKFSHIANKAADSIEDLFSGICEDDDNHERLKNLFDELEQTNTSMKGVLRNCTHCSGLMRREDLAQALGENVIDPDILDALLGEPHELKVVRIWENNDTPLANMVFHHPNVSQHFAYRAIVHGACGTDQMLSKIQSSFLLYNPRSWFSKSEDQFWSNIEDVGEYLYRRLEGRKYLIVLYGVPSFEIWDAIERYFPDDKVGSRVLLSGISNPGNSLKSLMEREDVVVGLGKDVRKIIDELTRPPSTLSVVTITGMGGIGKTTLAKKIYKHPYVSHYFHCCAWINNVSSIDQALSHLLHHVLYVSDEIQEQSTEEKGELLYRSLKGRKYVIVVDDLWNFEVWDAVQGYLPDDKTGSRILITTRMVEFPSCSSIRKNPPHCMALMNKDQSWEVLEKLAKYRFYDEEQVEKGKKIAEACGGLPLAIVVIAGIIEKSGIDLWWLLNNVISIVSANSEICMNILSFSYTNLPKHLQACFLYMGAFPANAEINVEYLLRLWVANGFLQSMYSSYLEIEAEEYLNDLIGRNLVSIGKRGFDGKIKTCFIHPLVRQLCLGEALKENFMHVLEAGADIQVTDNKRHLIFNLVQVDDSLPTHPRLCSIIWINRGSDFARGMVLLQMLVCTWLRVLDIYFVLFDTFPLQLLNLVNLRFLAMNVSFELDERMCQLSKLETFMVNGPWGPKAALFLEFWKMLCLRNVLIRVPGCLEFPYLLSSLVDAPQAQVSNILRHLSVIAISSCTRELFLLMPKLKKLGVSETKEDFENGELTKCFHNLSLLNELQALNCSFYKANREMRHIDLHVLPVCLQKLTLDGGYLPWDKIKPLALLPVLETLKLKNNAFQGPEWVVAEEIFGSLKHLLIENNDLVKWEVESTDNFPCLKRLVLRSCELLEMIPEGVAELNVLEVIELHGCSESAKASAQEHEEQYGSPKVVCSG